MGMSAGVGCSEAPATALAAVLVLVSLWAGLLCCPSDHVGCLGSAECWSPGRQGCGRLHPTGRSSAPERALLPGRHPCCASASSGAAPAQPLHDPRTSRSRRHPGPRQRGPCQGRAARPRGRRLARTGPRRRPAGDHQRSHRRRGDAPADQAPGVRGRCPAPSSSPSQSTSPARRRHSSATRACTVSSTRSTQCSVQRHSSPPAPSQS